MKMINITLAVKVAMMKIPADLSESKVNLINRIKLTLINISR